MITLQNACIKTYTEVDLWRHVPHEDKEKEGGSHQRSTRRRRQHSKHCKYYRHTYTANNLLQFHKSKHAYLLITYTYSYSYRVSLFNRIVLRGVMQCCRLVGKGESSASIGTAGDWCVVSRGQMEVRSRWQEPKWRNFAGQRMCLPVKRTSHHGQLSGVTDVTNPRLDRRLAWGRQDQYLGHSRRSRQQSWTVSSQWLAFLTSSITAISNNLFI